MQKATVTIIIESKEFKEDQSTIVRGILQAVIDGTYTADIEEIEEGGNADS